jgi:hypothetical protein
MRLAERDHALAEGLEVGFVASSSSQPVGGRVEVVGVVVAELRAQRFVAAVIIGTPALSIMKAMPVRAALR